MRYSLIFLFTILSSVSLADKNSLTGQWTDTETGDYWLDFNEMVWSGIDYGCKIKAINKFKNNQYKLDLVCDSEEERGWPSDLIIEKQNTQLVAILDSYKLPLKRATDEAPPIEVKRLPTDATGFYQEEIWKGDEAGHGDIKKWAKTHDWHCYNYETSDAKTCSILQATQDLSIYHSADNNSEYGSVASFYLEA